MESEGLKHSVLNHDELALSRSSKQLSNLTDSLYKNGFLRGLYSDIQVVAFETAFKLHKIVLIGNSYFAGFLNGNWRDSSELTNSNESVIRLTFDDPNITIESFSIVISR